MSYGHVIVEADGGSRGNPGPASYGALVRDPATGQVIAQDGKTIGIATNNVAEYSGLIAGLELAAEYAPNASIEVRMDSKLVIEQMAGRWKIKHPDMKPLAIKAQGLAPFGTEWTWVPRAQNSAADALANNALDGVPIPLVPEVGAPAPAAAKEPSDLAKAMQGWGAQLEPPTQLIFLRHGETPHTTEKRFSGSGGDDPSLNDNGCAQAEAAAQFLARRGGIDAIVTSPMRRARETAATVGAQLGLDTAVDDGWIECSFGDWDGHTFAEVQQKWPDALSAWLETTTVAPPGGESFDTCARRARSARDGLLTRFPGKTVLVVTHVTPIKLMVRSVLQAPMASIFRMELHPATLTEIHWYADGLASLRSFNVQPSLL
ncbi:bifunctional RNase H/acid phosphatase [Kribbella sandramycini]|uniref:Bifunctional RNase H/acid phosphatase n=1 Tax=Kribbella sandramycini TaxID=60450 RepID=A0A7Y4KUU8_9ACTN|nr:bifunctional RNase H/acid phosphatase [Kribbella sandramycini]MBB6568279.1 putative phosphoglycerate mutase [Kribbella sandramycini]NOL39128.1 bifunctional RNase H/acid phosphatase [Kribbella sandramycini]